MIPSPGRIVLYTLSGSDVVQINRRREDWKDNNDPSSAHTGFVAHVGNHAYSGDVYPAVIVRVWGDVVNLQVLLDGTDTFWATSRKQGSEPGTWAPPKE